MTQPPPLPRAQRADPQRRQVAQVAGSIREFGFTTPILIDGENGIIAGHGRVLAARKLGMTEMPCIEAAYLTPAQPRSYIIARGRSG